MSLKAFSLWLCALSVCLLCLLTPAAALAQSSAAATSVQLTQSQQALSSGQAVVALRAAITSASGPVSLGTVLFLDGSKQLGTVQVVSSNAAGQTPGTATYRRALGPGTHSIKAVFQGAASYASSNSAPVSVTVSGSSSTMPSLYINGTYPLPDVATGVTIADINGDGLPDVLLPLLDNGAVLILLNDPTHPGQLQSPITVSLPFKAAVGKIVVADVDGDGLPDMVVPLVNYMTAAFVFYQDAANPGTFSAPVTLGSGIGSNGLVFVRDIDGDGYPDIVFAGGNSVSVVPDPGHTPPPHRVTVYQSLVPDYSFTSEIADVNYDGLPDVVMGGYTTNNELEILNSDATNPGHLVASAPETIGSGAYEMKAFDLDGDGYVDLLAGTRDAGVQWLRNDPTHPGNFVPSQSFPVFRDALGLDFGDINGDGVPDVVTASGAPSFSVLYGNGAGSLGALQVYSSTPVSGTTDEVAVADLDGDGLDDVVSLVGRYDYVNVPTFQLNVSTHSKPGEKQPPAITLLNPSPTYAALGSPVTLTAQLASAFGSPTGLVTFNANGKSVGSATIQANGLASLVTATLPAGGVTLVAHYEGDGNFAPADSDVNSVSIQGLTPVVSATVTPASALVGSTFTFTAKVTGAGPQPTGIVRFLDNDSLVVAEVPVDGAGTATFTSATLGVGTREMWTAYLGDDTYAAVANWIKFSVLSIPDTATELIVSAAGKAAASVVAGTPVTLTASVTAGSAPVTTGQALFCETAYDCSGLHRLGEAQLTSTGSASFTYVPKPGSHVYVARFQPTQIAHASTSSFSTLLVTGSALSTMSLSADGQPGAYSLTANLSGAGTSITGTVSFLDQDNGGYVLGTVALGSKTAMFGMLASTLSMPAITQGVNAGDLNGDGIPDLAVASGSQGQIQIYLGKGDGSFAAGPTLQTVSIPGASYSAYGVLIADFNSDGHPDVAAMNRGDGSLTVFLGAGDGTFSATPLKNTEVATVDAFSLVVADLNGDGIPDIATANESQGTAAILLGRGDGTFSFSQTASFANSPRSIVTGDFNADGKPDLAFSVDGRGSVVVLLGKGDGTFNQSASTPSALTDPVALTVADFNGDGRDDLAVTNNGDNSVSILLGKGDGTFTAMSTLPATGSTPIEITSGDFDGDGRADLAVANESSNSVTILLGKGDGTFTASSVQVGTWPEFLAAGDWNGDGRSDLAVGNVGTSSVSILVAQGASSAQAVVTGISPLGTGTHHVIASYPGDRSYSAAVSNAVQLTAQPLTSNLTLSASAGSLVYGASVTLTAKLLPSVNAPLTTDGEMVVFQSDGKPIGSAALQGGSATLAISNLDVGARALTATYAGDKNLTASAASALSLTVTLATPTLQFTVADQSYGAAPFQVQATSTSQGTITYSVLSGPASINGSSVNVTGAGNVVLQAAQVAAGNYTSALEQASFKVNPASQTITFNLAKTATCGDAPISLAGQASSGLPVTFSVVSGPGAIANNLLSLTGAGAVVIAADQAGNANYGAATQVKQMITVSAATPAVTWSKPAAITFGTSLRGLLNAAASFGKDAVQGTYAYSANGNAVSDVSVLSPGDYVVSVVFTAADSSRFTTGSATVPLSVNKAGTGVSLVVSSSSIFVGNGVTLSAAVNSSVGTSGGTVTFLNGTTPLGSTPLNSGTASLSVTSLGVGSQVLSAVYSGDANFTGSTSPGVSEIVQDFTVSSSGTATPVQSGNNATYSFGVGTSGTVFPQAVVFSASGLPPGATATFTPSSIAAGAQATNVTLSINLASQTALRQEPSSRRGTSVASLLWMFPISLVWMRRLRSSPQAKRMLLLVIGSAALVVGATGLVGCGGGSPASTPVLNTYNVVITATSGSLTHSTTITIQAR